MVNATSLQKLLLLLPLAYPRTTRAPDSGAEWSYEDPQNWGVDYPQCNGNRQSPIHLRSQTSFVLPILPLRFANYDVPLSGNVNFTNNGHTVEFSVPVTSNGQAPSISGGILTDRYEAVNVHFHWGSPSTKGSEHVINNRRFDVEMHVVHKNVRYATVQEASRYRDGLAVLGVMFKIVDEPDRIYPGLYKVLDQLPSVVNYRSSVIIPGRLTLGQMLGDLNTKQFFTYSGSLTTPNCAEAVTWQVFPQPLPVARQQISQFWSILNEHGDPLLNNFRPLQNRNGRPVFYRSNVING